MPIPIRVPDRRYGPASWSGLRAPPQARGRRISASRDGPFSPFSRCCESQWYADHASMGDRGKNGFSARSPDDSAIAHRRDASSTLAMGTVGKGVWYCPASQEIRPKTRQLEISPPSRISSRQNRHKCSHGTVFDSASVQAAVTQRVLFGFAPSPEHDLEKPRGAQGAWAPEADSATHISARDQWRWPESSCARQTQTQA